MHNVLDVHEAIHALLTLAHSDRTAHSAALRLRNTGRRCAVLLALRLRVVRLSCSVEFLNCAKTQIRFGTSTVRDAAAFKGRRVGLRYAASLVAANRSCVVLGIFAVIETRV